MSRGSRRSILALSAAGLAMLLNATVARADSTAHLTLHSEPGDWVGSGQDWDITYSGSDIGFAQVGRTLNNGDPAFLWFFMNGDSANFASLSFGTDQLGIKIQPGIYTNAERASFASPGHPGLDVSF